MLPVRKLSKTHFRLTGPKIIYYPGIMYSVSLHERIVKEYWPRHDKMCLRESPTRPDTNRPAQLQRLARVLKFRL